MISGGATQANKRRMSLAQAGRSETPRQRKEQHKTHRIVNEEGRSTSPPTKAQRIGKEDEVKLAREVNPKGGSTAKASAMGGSTCGDTKRSSSGDVLDLSEVVDKKESSMTKTE